MTPVASAAGVFFTRKTVLYINIYFCIFLYSQRCGIITPGEVI
ncbi:hypothetical protein HMPREF0080_00912 [Anaeroglobus geminatus F0357]|uniref:Uncharacterized protein n=1 Tax=Anaeroglobus geminatus F0357 TaxID=861450 RepID=G9YGZ2_9FIRM|nr:hypothetical protein HMPREF0080_00912 [Anaeroglobus geminatus F0357]